MKINSLEISNILSIEHALITFEDKGLVLVEGFDHDTGRANGAGKSAIFNALSFALYDKLPRRITKSEIIRKGSSSGYATVEVQTSMGRYMVKRIRPGNASFYKDGIEITITQEEFESKIGLNYEQFMITMYTSQDSSERFIDLNDVQKKAFILKVMNLDKFTKAKQQASIEQDLLSKQKDILLTKIDGLKTNASIYKESMINVNSFKSRIDENNADIFKYTSVIKSNEEIKEPDLTKYTETESKINQKLMLFAEIRFKKDQEQLKIRSLSKSLTPFLSKQHDAECPDCSAKLNIQGKTLAKADDIVALKKQWQIHQNEIQNQISEHEFNSSEYESQLLKETEVKELVTKIKLKKQEEYFDYSTAQSIISEHKNSINLKTAENKTLQNQIDKNSEIKIKFKEVLENAKLLSSKLEEINNELFIVDAVFSIFDSTGAPAYVMDTIIESFNDAVAEYVSEIWPNATYTLQTYKENKDKTIKAKLSETLMIGGKERSIGSLSGGELRALSIALDLAIIEVLGSQYDLAMNPIILDEPFNGLDASGRELVVDILSKVSQNKQIWIVDHASETKAMFDKVITVEKRNGISNISQ